MTSSAASLDPSLLEHLRQFDKDTWRIELVEEWDGHLKKREEYWRITLGATLNEKKAYVSPEEKAEAPYNSAQSHRENHNSPARKGRILFAK